VNHSIDREERIEPPNYILLLQLSKISDAFSALTKSGSNLFSRISCASRRVITFIYSELMSKAKMRVSEFRNR
jgi:hypothetical protein